MEWLETVTERDGERERERVGSGIKRGKDEEIEIL